VNKDPLSLLRLGLPKQPKDIRDLQAALEECQDNLARLNSQVAASALSKAKGAAKGGASKILKAVPAAKAAQGQTALAAIDAAMDEIKGYMSANKVADALAANERALKQVTVLEELIADGYEQPAPPAEFANLPYLKGRAVVDMTITPGPEHEGGQFDVEGTLYKQVRTQQSVAATCQHCVGLHSLPSHWSQPGFTPDCELSPRLDLHQTSEPMCPGLGAAGGEWAASPPRSTSLLPHACCHLPLSLLCKRWTRVPSSLFILTLL